MQKNSGTKAQAIDLFQETIISFYENVKDGRFNGNSAISTYLFSIARFKWINQLEKEKVRTKHYLKASAETEKVKTEETWITKEREQDVLKIFNLLEKSCRNVLIQSVFYQASIKEIMETENFSSEQVVRNKKYKCLKKLRTLIAQRPDIIKMLKGHE